MRHKFFEADYLMHIMSNIEAKRAGERIRITTHTNKLNELFRMSRAF